MSVAAVPCWPSGQLPAQQFCDEGERLRVAASFGLDDLCDDPGLEAIAAFAARLCETPIALVSLVEAERQRFLAGTGLDASETPRSDSFCAHAMLRNSPLVVCDAREDPLFAANRLVTGEPYIRFYAGVPLISHEGAPLGALCVIDRHARPDGLSDLQEEGLRVLATAAMERLEGHRSNLFVDGLRQESERRFQTIIETLPDITWSANPKGEITYINRRWTEYTGLPATDHDSDHIRAAYHPDEVEPWREDWLAAIQRGEPYEGEYRLRRKDGSYGWIMARAMPLRNAEGVIESWFGQLIDIDDRHRQADARELLARELAHRIKNIFSVVSSLISMRARATPEVKPFAEELTSTIYALGRAQEFARPSQDGGEEELRSLLEALMLPYNGERPGCVSVRGQGVKFGQRAATPLALAFHELATNATKYGALSKRQGHVEIEISKKDEDVVIRWAESGGPALDGGPESTGFGTRLIDSTFGRQLRGEVSYDWKPSGLELIITLPQAQLLQ